MAGATVIHGSVGPLRGSAGPERDLISPHTRLHSYSRGLYSLPLFRPRFGKVVNIGSNLVYNPVVTYYDYTAAKAALVALTRNLAAELGPSPMSKSL